MNSRLEEFEKIAGRKSKEIPCEVKDNPVQEYAVWFGGSYLGSQDGFTSVCKTREQYLEYGPSICRHNAIFGGGM